MIYIVIGIIIIIVVLILLSFLLIPLKISFYIEKLNSDIKGKFTLKWLGIGIISREIPGEEKANDKKKEKEDAEKDDEKEEKFNLDGILNILNLFLEAWPHIHKLIKTIYQSITLERFSLNLTMGLESTADTAMFTGYIWAFTNPLQALTPIHVRVIPEFSGRVLDGDLDIEFKIKLIWIVLDAIKAYTKKPVRELINELRK